MSLFSPQIERPYSSCTPSIAVDRSTKSGSTQSALTTVWWMITPITGSSCTCIAPSLRAQATSSWSSPSTSATSIVRRYSLRQTTWLLGKDRKLSKIFVCIPENVGCIPLAVVIWTTANGMHPAFSGRHPHLFYHFRSLPIFTDFS